MQLQRIFSLTILFVILLIHAGCAGPNFSRGINAYHSGDYVTALKNLQPLAEQGYADAQYSLGVLYSKGQGVPQDDKVAARWYKLAAEQGFPQAQFNLGLRYKNGRGVTQDYNAAFKLFKLAAEQGIHQAQCHLGVMYHNGEGVTQNYKAALKWYKLAADQGCAVAPYNLGQMYKNGLGVTQDYARAYMWWDIAASRGYEDAKAGRADVQKLMTSTQIAEAQKLVRECEAKIYKGC